MAYNFFNLGIVGTEIKRRLDMLANITGGNSVADTNTTTALDEKIETVESTLNETISETETELENTIRAVESTLNETISETATVLEDAISDAKTELQGNIATALNIQNTQNVQYARLDAGAIVKADGSLAEDLFPNT